MLDTNVVMDWMVFNDPCGQCIGQAIGASGVAWLATAEMRAEHFEVVAREQLRRWSPDVDTQIRLWELHCQLLEVGPPGHDPKALLCRDPEDQMFVDLAVTARPTWLLSRDKALLTMAPALRRLGVEVMTPARWVADQRKRAGAAP